MNLNPSTIVLAISITGGALMSVSAQPVPERQPPADPTVRIVDGMVEIGGVRVDRDARSVSFPASVNMDQDLIEYAIVDYRGKTHESLLSTKVAPQNIHLAMLLVGLEQQPVTVSEEVQRPPERIDPSYLETTSVPSGAKVKVTVRWKNGATPVVKPLNELLLSVETGKAPAISEWIYNGSLVENGRFLAQDDGGITALITDPVALINHANPKRTDDLDWKPNAAVLPPVDTPVTVRIDFVANPSTANTSHIPWLRGK